MKNRLTNSNGKGEKKCDDDRREDEFDEQSEATVQGEESHADADDPHAPEYEAESGCKLLCKKPLRQGVLSYGCGQCLPCRINKRRIWTARLMLERMEHENATFLTLTYNEDNLPKDLCVSKREVQLFLKKLRNKIAPRTVRYFFVGEYGEKGQRPHYHAILYGISPTETKLIESIWNKGHVLLGTAEPKSMSYCGSYVVKGYTKKGNPLLNGRAPEFALMSRNPGLGAKYAERVIKAYKTNAGQSALDAYGWFATTWKYQGKTYPLAKYIQQLVAKGLDKTPEERKRHNQYIATKAGIENRYMTATHMAEKEQRQKTKDDQHLKRKAIRKL